MPDIILRDVRDLLDLPAIRPTTLANTTYSFGDTHGNAIALIRYIYDSGLIALDNTQYQQLLTIYDLDQNLLTTDDLDRFRDIIRHALHNSGDLPLNVRLRLFGDLLADRGKNDIFTLIVLEELKLQYPTLNLNILLSNHDKVLLRAYLTGELFDDSLKVLPVEAQPCPSIFGLKTLLLKKVVSEAVVRRMINSAYLPHLKLIDYVVKGKGIDVMSHAPLTLQAIEQAMLTLLKPQDHVNIYSSVENLTTIIDKINALFVPTVNTAGDYKFNRRFRDALINSPDARNILYNFIWPRLSDISSLPASDFTRHTYTLRFRHGHDGDPGNKHIHGVEYIGYNNLLGKLTPAECARYRVAITNVFSQLSASVYPITREEISQAGLDAIAYAGSQNASRTSPTTAGASATEAVDDSTMATGPSSAAAAAPARTDAAAAPARTDAAAAPAHTDAAAPAHTDADASINYQQADIDTLKTLCIVFINKYISTRGSITGTDLGDQFWTGAVRSRNCFCEYVFNPILRLAPGVTHGLSTADVPRVETATAIKTRISMFSSEAQDLPHRLTELLAAVQTMNSSLDGYNSKELQEILTNITTYLEPYIATGRLSATVESERPTLVAA